MTTITGVVRYRIAGLPTSLLSAARTEATVGRVAFGRVEGRGGGANLGIVGKVLRQWWSSQELEEPSFTPDLTATPAEVSIVKAGLLKSDSTLTQAATCVALAQALAERAPIKDLPSLDRTVIVGALAPEGTLSCPPSCTAGEIARVCKGIGAQRLVGPFSADDPALQGISVQPADNVQDLLRVAPVADPAGIIRLALEWLVLFDPETQGAEAALWHEAERRAAENLTVLVSWFDEVKQRLPRSRVIRATLTALESLAQFQTDGNMETLERTCAQLENTGYRLTAVWLLTRWSFLLREQRDQEGAERCLRRADEIQQTLPLAGPVPVVLHQRGRSLYYQARFAEALEQYWRAYGFLQQASGADELRADFYNSAGKCFNDIYQFAMALELCERARQVRITLGQDNTLARTYGAMGETYWRAGELTEAEHCYRQQLDLWQQGGQAGNTMRTTNYLANVLFAQGKVEEAGGLYRDTEAYYRAQMDKGESGELKNLVYSIEGLARVAAAQGSWGELQRVVEENFEMACRSLAPDEAEVLPVALLGYLDALRLRHEGDVTTAAARLVAVEKLLQPLYPAELAVVLIEQTIGDIHQGPPDSRAAMGEHEQLLEKAAEVLLGFLGVADRPEVVRAFAPIRREVEQGRGELGGKGQDLLAQDTRRRQELSELFAVARGQLAAGQWSEATFSLRKIQESVVFFRDLLKQISPLP